MKNRKIIIVAIVMVLLFAQFSVLIGNVNADGSYGGVSWTFDSETGTLTFSGSGEIMKFWQINVEPDKVKKVVINNGITSIGNEAFWLCSNSTSIEIPSSVTSIGEYAFRGCSSLTSIEIPNGITSIESGAFSYCDNLTSIDLPNGITSIESFLFEGSSALTNIKIPNSVTTIGRDAFKGCTRLVNIEIPNSVKTIGRFAFEECESLTSIEIPNSVTSIDIFAFENCTSLSNVKLPDNIKSISSCMFAGCTSLKNIEIPSSVKSIKATAFESTGLTSVEIPNSVTSIEEWAFADCTNLTSIAIPESVKTIDGENGEVFARCDNLTVYCKSDSTIHHYVQENNIQFVLDDTAPTINKLSQEGSKIRVEATDNEGGCGLSSKPYSIDGENWQSSNEISVTEEGKYTVYVKDKLGNIVSGTINVTISKANPEETEQGDKDSKNENQKDGTKNDAEEKVENSSNSKNDSEKKSENSKDDKTKSNKVIPQAGATFSISFLVVLAIIGLVNYKKSKKYNY